MQIRETTDPLEEIPAEVLVLFHLEDEPTPRGRLGHVDWILCGAVSRLRVRGKFAGEQGATVLLSSNAKLKAGKVLVVGLGRQAELSTIALYRLSYQAAQTILQLGCVHIALEPPFRAFPGEVPTRVRQAFLEGFLAELVRGRPDTAFSVTILPPPNGD
jgi:hypothetical protein